MLVREINLKEIIERKVEYVENSDAYKDTELQDVKKGELKAYREIMEDLEALYEQEFVEKYLKILEQLKCQLETIEYGTHASQVEQLSGYNNAIVFTLTLLNPRYEF